MGFEQSHLAIAPSYSCPFLIKPNIITSKKANMRTTARVYMKTIESSHTGRWFIKLRNDTILYKKMDQLKGCPLNIIN